MLSTEIMVNKKGGRPRKYSKKLADEICETISKNPKSLKYLCDQRDHWPCKTTVIDWTHKYPEFLNGYREAKRKRTEIHEDLILEIIEDDSEDMIVGAHGNMVANSAKLTRVTLQCKYLLRLMAILNQGKYGPTTRTEITTPQGIQITSISAVTTDPIEAAKIYQQVMGGKE
jgi:hypothetical protein